MRDWRNEFQKATDMRRDVKINDIPVRIGQDTIRSDIFKKSATVNNSNTLAEAYRD